MLLPTHRSEVQLTIYVQYLIYSTQQQGGVLDHMDIKRKSYTPEFKRTVVLECMQRDSTQEEVCEQFETSSSMLHRWRKEFQANAESRFHDKRDPNEISSLPGQSPDDLKKNIGELTVQNERVKKASGLVRK